MSTLAAYNSSPDKSNEHCIPVTQELSSEVQPIVIQPPEDYCPEEQKYFHRYELGDFPTEEATVGQTVETHQETIDLIKSSPELSADLSPDRSTCTSMLERSEENMSSNLSNYLPEEPSFLVQPIVIQPSDDYNLEEQIHELGDSSREEESYEETGVQRIDLRHATIHYRKASSKVSARLGSDRSKGKVSNKHKSSHLFYEVTDDASGCHLTTYTQEYRKGFKLKQSLVKQERMEMFKCDDCLCYVSDAELKRHRHKQNCTARMEMLGRIVKAEKETATQASGQDEQVSSSNTVTFKTVQQSLDKLERDRRWKQLVRQDPEKAAKLREATRIAMEKARKDPNKAPLLREASRVAKEKARKDPEKAAKMREATRVAKEQARKDPEKLAKMKEASRLAREKARKDPEKLAKMREASRLAREKARKDPEKAAKMREASRVAMQKARKDPTKAPSIREKARIAMQKAREDPDKAHRIRETARLAMQKARRNPITEPVVTETMENANEICPTELLTPPPLPQTDLNLSS